MRILFITGQSIKSNTSATLMNLAYIKGFIELGHSVDIICPLLNKDHISYDDSISDFKNIKIREVNTGVLYNSLSSKKKQNILIIKLKGLLRRIYYSISIYDAQKMWVNEAGKISLENKEYDYIISSSDPKHSHLFAEKIYETNKNKIKKWVQIWGDPWALDITINNRLIRDKAKREEKRLLLKADNIFYVSPLTVRAQKDLYKDLKEKISLLPIAYYKNYNDSDSIRRLENDSDIVLGYFGDYNSEIRDIKPLYNVCMKNNINLYIRGNSDIEYETNNNIDIGTRVSLEELKYLEEKSDVFVHLSNKKGTQIPAKVFYYTSSSKPILFILDGDSVSLYEYFKRFDRFVFCENNEKSILNAIDEIRKIYKSQIKYEAINDFDPKIVISNMVKELQGNE